LAILRAPIPIKELDAEEARTYFGSRPIRAVEFEKWFIHYFEQEED